MPTRSFTNFNGMNMTAGYDDDALWYLQDASIIGNHVRQRPRLPSSAITHTGGSYKAAGSIGEKAASIAGADLNIFTSSGYSSTAASVSWTSGMDTFPVAGMTGSAIGCTRVGDNVLFWEQSGTSGSYVVAWSGCGAVATLDGDANITSGSTLIQFNTPVTGLDSTYVGAKLYLGLGSTVARTITYVHGTSAVVVDVAPVVTDASIEAKIAPISLLEGGSGFNEEIQTVSTYLTPAQYSRTGYSLIDTAGVKLTSTNVVAYAAEGHQGRLFVSNGNEVRYSGEEADVTAGLGGVNYWDADSVFQVAPEMGSRVERMVSFNNDLIMFKDTGICVLRGVVSNGDPSRLGARVDTINTHLECASYHHVVPTPIGAILVSRQGIYLVSGDGVQQIGQEVWPRLAQAFGADGQTSANDTPCQTSFTMDHKAYIYFEVNADSKYVYIVFDYTTGAWQFRTFGSALAPGCATAYNSTTTGNTVTVAFPHDSSANRGISFVGSELYGNITPAVDDVVSGSLFTNDVPQLVVATAPMASRIETTPSHMRVRNVWVNGQVPSEDDTKTFIANNLGASYGFTVTDFTTATESTYVLSSTSESWFRQNIASDPYGWSKSVVIYNEYDGSGSTQDFYLRGIAVEYDESGVAP